MKNIKNMKNKLSKYKDSSTSLRSKPFLRSSFQKTSLFLNRIPLFIFFLVLLSFPAFASGEEQHDISNGVVNVSKQCSGDGSSNNPWVSEDGSAGIRPSLAKVTPQRKVLYFPPGIYATKGAQEIDFSKDLKGIDNPDVKNSLITGLKFEGNLATIRINGGGILETGKPGILFNWPLQGVFYWKWIGLSFSGSVNAPLVQFGVNPDDFALNSCDMDLILNNGYIPSDFEKSPSPSRAIKVFRALESQLHFVAVSGTGYGAELDECAFNTIRGAFSNTTVGTAHRMYPFSYGLRLNNSCGNNFTSMDLEVATNGIKFDGMSDQNTFSAIVVGNCDSKGFVLDNRGQTSAGKNVLISVRNGPTYLPYSHPAVNQEKFFPGSNKEKFMILNWENYDKCDSKDYRGKDYKKNPNLKYETTKY